MLIKEELFIHLYKNKKKFEESSHSLRKRKKWMEGFQILRKVVSPQILLGDH